MARVQTLLWGNATDTPAPPAPPAMS
jgi:hypothetical protein